MRNTLDQPTPDTCYREKQEDNAGNEDRAKRLLPREAHSTDDRKGEEGIQAHTRCHANRPIGDERHDNRTQCCRKTCSNEDCVAIHTCCGQNIRIDEDNVRHRQEGRHASDDFRSHRCAMFLQFEQLFQHGPSRAKARIQRHQ
ncbi:hypothetical protein D9M69_590850 [compost metagenome]